MPSRRGVGVIGARTGGAGTAKRRTTGSWSNAVTPAQAMRYDSRHPHGVPQDQELLWPVLQAVSERGGSASIDEIVETVSKRDGFSEAQQSVLHNDGPETEIGYRLAWARTHLKGMGLLTNSTRGDSYGETGRKANDDLHFVVPTPPWRWSMTAMACQPW